MSLSTDVLDLILSFLQEDCAALGACSESHPILSQLAERYSYTHITVDENATIQSEIRVQVGVKLTDVLSRKPCIAKYIRSLEIKIGSDSLSQELPTILSLDSLPRLTTITLSSGRGSIGWQSLPESFRTAFIASFNLPSIRGISIVWISGFPLSALNGCNKVKDLTLDGWHWDGVNITPGDVNSPLRLESLSIKSCSGQSLEKLITWAPTHHLRVLELSRRHPSDYAEIPELLSKCSNSLTSLSVDLGIHCASYSSPLIDFC